jgi:hypothetical protein
MYQWPINLRECGSPQKMTDYCHEIIEQLGRISTVGNSIIRILPTFEMSNQTGLHILKLIEGQNVFINEEYYIKFELDRRVIYISKDSADKRPFIYWAGIDPYNGKNDKYILEELIIGPVQDPRTKVIYRDNDIYNLKMTNITFETKDPTQLLEKRHNHLQEKLSSNTTVIDSIPEEVKVNEEEKEALQDVIFGEKDKIIIDEKVQSILSKVSHQKGDLSQLEQTYLMNGRIDPSDINADYTHKWYGVGNYETKKSIKYKAIFKGVAIQSGFDHPVDAAKAYNKFILDNGLPYPINNIPGFLELEVLENRKNIALKEYKTWELLEEALKRTKIGS